MRYPDAIVIGAGVIGSAIAFELAKAGAQTTLLEQATVACGASGMSAAMLEAHLDIPEEGPFRDLALQSQALYPQLATELQELTGRDIGYQRCGILRLAASETEQADLRERFEWQSAAGLSTQWWEPGKVTDRLPGLQGPLFGAIYYADDGQVLASRLTATLVEALKAKGGIVHEGARVTGFDVGDQRVLGVRTTAGCFTASQIIIAAGPWSPELTQWLGFSLPIEPVRGQLLRYCPADPLPFPIYASQGYIVPKPDGVTLVGSTQEHVGFSTETTPAAVTGLRAFAGSRFPSLADSPFLGAVAGLRPGPLPDGLPAIGPLPDLENVLLAAGHFRNGILLAPITAKLIAARVCGLALPTPGAPYLPARPFPALANAR